jgi:NitT/TauT family transport system ATP-binding protein
MSATLERPGAAAAPPSAPHAAASISVERVSKVYTTRSGPIEALHDIDFAVDARQFVAVVGPSGCGKSTLLKILAGLIPVTSGEARMNRSRIDGPRRDVGVVFQAPVLFPWRSVIDNVLLPVDVQRLGRERFRDRALELLALVGLRGFESRLPSELSGGMQQRAAIVRALIHGPGVLLMDEPFGALDALTRERLNLELQRIWIERRDTVVFITHSIAEAVFLADRVLVMSARPGRLIDDVAIALARPRTLDAMTAPAFGACVQRIRAALEARGGLDR